MNNLTEEEFNQKKELYLKALDNVQLKYTNWFDANLGYYKGGIRPTLSEMTSVLLEQNKIIVSIGLKDIPTAITEECFALQKKIFG